MARAGRESRFDSLLEVIQDGELTLSMRHGFAYTWAARGYLHFGRLDEAETLCRNVFEDHAADPERGVQAWANWILSDIAWRRGQVEEAQQLCDVALETARELDMAPLVAHCGDLRAKFKIRPDLTINYVLNYC